VSHPLGSLNGHGPAIAAYSYGQMAMRSALTAAHEHRYATAACWCEAAADAALTLSALTEPGDPARAAAWLACADQRETWAEQAWAAARPAQPTIPARPGAATPTFAPTRRTKNPSKSRP